MGFLTSFGFNAVFAKDNLTKKDYQKIAETDAVLLGADYIVGPEDLKKNGWEIVETKEQPSISPFSTAGNAKITNTLMKSSTNQGLYLAQVIWDKGGLLDWDATSDKALDYVALSLSQSGKALSTSAQNAGIKVMNDRTTVYSGNGWVDSYNKSAALYAIQDSGPNDLFGIGSYGSAWFYIAKPATISGEIVMNSRWTHTWASSNVTLNSLTLSYPFSISATWSSSSLLKSWNISDQDVVQFN